MSHQRQAQTKSAPLVGLERWMESNRLNEYLFQLWIQNQVWFLGPPTQHVMEQSPALKKGAPCPAELEAELVLSFLVTLSVLLAPGRAESERKEAG